MQRTVYSTKFTYVENEIVNGEIISDIRTITVHETNEKRAYKIAAKEIGNFKPIKTEKISQLFVLDDEIFFKYAKPVEAEAEAEA